MKTYAVFNDSFFTYKPWWLPTKLHRVVCNRSNPRTEEYMTKLLHEKFPEFELVSLDNLSDDGKIVLLYPDAIGLGWSSMEKKLLKQFRGIIILNGRKRSFELTSKTRLNLLLRRFLEVTFLPEICVVPLLFVFGVILAIKDKLVGRS